MPVSFAMPPPPTLQPDIALRRSLLDCYLEYATSPELVDWLRQLGQETRGDIGEKRERVRATTKYLSMPPAEFPQQTIHYLEQYQSNHLTGICEAIGVNPEGTKDAKWRRILREVGFREGWLSRPAAWTESLFTVERLGPFVEWHMVTKRGEYEKDLYPAFAEEMEEVFGEDFVHSQLPIAFGTTLKIDFHLGHPQREGVGVEFKMPSNNADIQRAIGQMDQYRARYGENLVVVLFPDFLDKAQQMLFIDKLSERKIQVILK